MAVIGCVYMSICDWKALARCHLECPPRCSAQLETLGHLGPLMVARLLASAICLPRLSHQLTRTKPEPSWHRRNRLCRQRLRTYLKEVAGTVVGKGKKRKIRRGSALLEQRVRGRRRKPVYGAQRRSRPYCSCRASILCPVARALRCQKSEADTCLGTQPRGS